MPSLFPEYFQGIPESRGLFDHIFVLVLHEPASTFRYRNLPRQVPTLDAERLFAKIAPGNVPRHYYMVAIPEAESGAKSLADLLGQLKVEVTEGETTGQALLRDFFP